MISWRDLFTPRQLVALTTFSDLVGEAMERVRRDAVAAGLPDDDRPLRDGGTGAAAYAEAVAVYLAFALSKTSNIGSSIASWMSDRGAFRETFARQAIPMVWDFAEANPLAGVGGSLETAIDKGAMTIDAFPAGSIGWSVQLDAASQTISRGRLISTDPPYYDNIGYADLSDFFYVWLRRSLKPVFPDLFATLAVPKAAELVATPYRHGGKKEAETFFLDGMTQALRQLSEQAHPGFPVTIYYAFKQSETKEDTGTASTGWETFLDAVIRSGFAITGTWPMRTEGAGRIIAKDTNALASSIVLVCRRRPTTAPTATRREFLTALRSELPQALRLLQSGNVAPVDFAQAAIGPGMAVFTRYAKVLDAAGTPMSVREALALINEILDEVLAEQEGDIDADSRWALAWFEQYGFAAGDYGVAETLSKAKNTSVAGLVRRRDPHVTGRHGAPLDAEGAAKRLGPDRRYAADRVGDGPPPDPCPRGARRDWCGGARRPARRHGRHRPRALLPAVHAVRTEEARGRGAVVQRPRAELARDHPLGTVCTDRAGGAVRRRTMTHGG